MLCQTMYPHHKLQIHVAHQAMDDFDWPVMSNDILFGVRQSCRDKCLLSCHLEDEHINPWTPRVKTSGDTKFSNF